MRIVAVLLAAAAVAVWSRCRGPRRGLTLALAAVLAPPVRETRRSAVQHR